MSLNKDSEYNIQQRQQGKDSLSWIENFGLHLFEKDCKPKVFFKNGEVNEILVLRINRKENVISTYLCFFKTNDKGYTRFSINKVIDYSAVGLKELMEKAKWADESTKEYWKEVFRDNKTDIDEDTMKRPEVLAYADAKMVMIDFIGQIKNEFRNVVNKLSIDNKKISKVFIVEQYAYALPVQYSLRKIFPNAERNVSGFLFKEWEKRYSWFHIADRFYIPEELLHTEFNTSSNITIGDVFKFGENGIIITLPIEEKDGKYSLPSTPMIKGCDLKWSELIKVKVPFDYKADNLLFKRLQLSMIADGFQTVYIKCDTEIVACSVYENGRYQIKSLSPYQSKEAQKPMDSKLELNKKSNGIKSETEITEAKPSMNENYQTLTTSNSDSKKPQNNEVEVIKENDGSELIKMADLNGEIQKALTLTLNLLRQKAYSYISKHHPSKTVGVLYDEWIYNKRITGASYSPKLIANWEEFKGKNDNWDSYTNPKIPESNTRMLDWGNYYVFIEQNWNGLIKDWNGKENLKTIIANLKKIKEMLRNDSSHQNVYNFEKEELIDLITYMRSIVGIFESKGVNDKIAQIRSKVFEIM